MTIEYFSSIKEVLTYLKGADWKISQRTLYRHKRQGLLKPEVNGTFALKIVDRYAVTYLLAGGTVRKLGDARLQRLKLEQEIALKREEIKTRKFRNSLDAGRYILRENMELELAGRAVVLETGLKGMILAKVGEFVALVGGQEKKAGDLVRAMMAELDQTLNEFATTKEFHVIFRANAGGTDIDY